MVVVVVVVVWWCCCFVVVGVIVVVVIDDDDVVVVVVVVVDDDVVVLKNVHHPVIPLIVVDAINLPLLSLLPLLSSKRIVPHPIVVVVIIVLLHVHPKSKVYTLAVCRFKSNQSISPLLSNVRVFGFSKKCHFHECALSNRAPFTPRQFQNDSHTLSCRIAWWGAKLHFAAPTHTQHTHTHTQSYTTQHTNIHRGYTCVFHPQTHTHSHPPLLLLLGP